MKKELFERITSETPKWFKKIRNLGLTLGAVGTALKAYDAISPNEIPASVLGYVGYFITAGIIAAAVAGTAKKDSTKG